MCLANFAHEFLPSRDEALPASKDLGQSLYSYSRGRQRAISVNILSAPACDFCSWTALGARIGPYYVVQIELRSFSTLARFRLGL